MKKSEFFAIPNGTRVYNHSWDQCVALANLYHESVIGGSFVPVGSAYQWWTEFKNYDTLTKNYTQHSTPKKGDIFVARYGIYDAPNGHIGVVTSVNSNGTFNTMEQNAGTWRYVGRYTRDLSNVLGFLRPKTNTDDDLGGIMAFYSSKTAFRNDIRDLIRAHATASPMKSGFKDKKGNDIKESLGSAVRRGHKIGRQNREKLARVEGQLKALSLAVKQLSGGQIDVEAIQKAAYEGALKGVAEVEAAEVAELLQVTVKDGE